MKTEIDEANNTPETPEVVVQCMLEDLRNGCTSELQDSVTPVDNALNLLTDKNALFLACQHLTVMGKDKKIDIQLQACIVLMTSVLNLFLDKRLDYTWKMASIVVAQAQGRGVACACVLWEWLLCFLKDKTIPAHQSPGSRWSVIEDKDVANEIQMALTEKTKGCGYLTATDLIKVVESAPVQACFAQLQVLKPSICEHTARHWMKKMNYHYGRHPNGMYIDGHEKDEVVEYQSAFVERWKIYESRFHLWDNEGSELPQPRGFPVPGHRFCLILITHDESTFFQNDNRKTFWQHTSKKGMPKPKGEGHSIMISDFLSSEWGPLRDNDGCVTLLFLTKLF